MAEAGRRRVAGASDCHQPRDGASAGAPCAVPKATENMSNDLVIGMAGSGGDGIVSAGDAMITAAALEGYHAVLTKSFGPQIRGGESSCRVRALDPTGAELGRDPRRGRGPELGGLPQVRGGAARRRADDGRLRERDRGPPGPPPAARRDAVGGDRGPDRGDGEEERRDREGQELGRPRPPGGLAGRGARVLPGGDPEEVRQEGRRGPAGQRERLRRRRAVRRGPPAARAAHARGPRPGR